jgi:molybdopterin-guanine dinucleotide biosynthesis protein
MTKNNVFTNEKDRWVFRTNPAKPKVMTSQHGTLFNTSTRTRIVGMLTSAQETKTPSLVRHADFVPFTFTRTC